MCSCAILQVLVASQQHDKLLLLWVLEVEQKLRVSQDFEFHKTSSFTRPVQSSTVTEYVALVWDNRQSEAAVCAVSGMQWRYLRTGGMWLDFYSGEPDYISII